MFFRGTRLQPYRIGITASVLAHLILDQKCNPSRSALTYFLAHRIRHRFDANLILKERILTDSLSKNRILGKNTVSE
jgi:hypothetical protein